MLLKKAESISLRGLVSQVSHIFLSLLVVCNLKWNSIMGYLDDLFKFLAPKASAHWTACHWGSSRYGKVNGPKIKQPHLLAPLDSPPCFHNSEPETSNTAL